MHGTFEAMDTTRLQKLVRRVRNRWRLRILMRGVAIALITGFAVLTFSSWGLDFFRYRPWALFLFSVGTYGILFGLLVRYVALPLTRRVDDEQVALYIGEHAPGLQAEILGAVSFADAAEAEDRPDMSPALARRVVREAMERAHEIEYGRGVERTNLRRFGTVLSAVAAGVLMAVALSPAFLRVGAPLLLMPWTGTAFANPYAIDVRPGDTDVARGADQLIEADLRGFDAERVEIAVKRESGGEWNRWPMTLDEGATSWSFLLLDLEHETEYYIEASGVRSDVHRIRVTDLPYVSRIDLTYEYPQYSGLSTETVEDTGDIAVLRGTRVRLTATPTVEVPGGQIVFELEGPVQEGRRTLELEPAGDGTLTASFEVDSNGTYGLELEAFTGDMVSASSRYFIDVLTDQPPHVSFDVPGRDTTVSPIDEAFVELVAEDDYGLLGLELVYSVNGAEEQTVSLYRADAEGADLPTELSASHTFYLEEWELQPGDFVSYYARARDRRAGGAETSTTDIYFVEVQPFDRSFRQGQQAGGGGGGRGQGMQNVQFAQRQRQIVAATFALVRDRDEYAEAEWQGELSNLAVVQGRLREQVELILGRVAQRGAVSPGSDFDKMADNYRSAIAEMVPAEEQLGTYRAEEALGPEQRALQYLQRADALMRDVQVSFGGGGAGGGQQAAGNEELADLLDLEMEKLRNQYETVRRDQQQQVDEEVDEALERLEELARRQQKENERARRLQNAPRNLASQGGTASQRQLADETEELARQLERLSREQQEPQLRDLARRLQDAADSMRRAAAGTDEESLAEGIDALDRLSQTRERLESERSRRLQRDMDDALQRVQQMQAAQEKIAQEVQELGEQSSGEGADEGSAEQMDRVMDRKDELAGEVAGLEAQVDQMARESRREQREASRELEETASWMRDSKLADKIRYSKGVAQQRLGDYAEQFERQIGADLESLEEMLQEAQSAISESDQDRMAGNLDETRDLVRGLESLQERMQAAAEGRLDRQPQPGETQGPGQEQGQQQGQPQDGAGQRDQQGVARPGQQQGQQQGRAGDQQQFAGPYTGGTGGRIRPDELRQFRSEYDRRLREARELRDRLADDGYQVTDLDAVINSMSSLALDGTPRGIEELRASVIEDLKLFEYALRRLADPETARRPSLADSDEVPERYRELVEEYFRSLSRDAGTR